MNRHYENKAFRTVELIEQLINDDISNISVLLRHSERHYTRDGAMEPFMRLTQNGRKTAHEFGHELPDAFSPKLFSSFIGRCIETAYLIDKGFSAHYGAVLPHTRNEYLLSPFYIKDIEKVVSYLENGGDHIFLRNWFDGNFDTKMIDNPKETVKQICNFMTDQLDRVVEGTITLCVTHDWNIFPVKEFMLGLPFEKAGDIGYLEGVIFYKKDNLSYIVGIDTDPVPIKSL